MEPLEINQIYSLLNRLSLLSVFQSYLAEKNLDFRGFFKNIPINASEFSMLFDLEQETSWLYQIDSLMNHLSHTLNNVETELQLLTDLLLNETGTLATVASAYPALNRQQLDMIGLLSALTAGAYQSFHKFESFQSQLGLTSEHAPLYEIMASLIKHKLHARKAEIAVRLAPPQTAPMSDTQQLSESSLSATQVSDEEFITIEQVINVINNSINPYASIFYQAILEKDAQKIDNLLNIFNEIVLAKDLFRYELVKLFDIINYTPSKDATGYDFSLECHSVDRPVFDIPNTLAARLQSEISELPKPNINQANKYKEQTAHFSIDERTRALAYYRYLIQQSEQTRHLNLTALNDTIDLTNHLGNGGMASLIEDLPNRKTITPPMQNLLNNRGTIMITDEPKNQEKTLETAIPEQTEPSTTNDLSDNSHGNENSDRELASSINNLEALNTNAQASQVQQEDSAATPEQAEPSTTGDTSGNSHGDENSDRELASSINNLEALNTNAQASQVQPLETEVITLDPTPAVTTDAVNMPRTRADSISTVSEAVETEVLDEKEKQMVAYFLKYYQTLRNNEHLSMFRSNFVSQLTGKDTAEQYKMIQQHMTDKPASRTAKAWQLTQIQFDQTSELQEQKLTAFARIYQALYKGQSSIKSKNFVDTLLNVENLSRQDIYYYIQQHLLQKPNSRTAYAWKLVEQHYANCNSDNIELLKNIYEYSFAHSRLGSRAQVGGQIFYRSAPLKDYLDNTEHQSGFKEKVAQINSSQNQVPHTRLARIIAALREIVTFPFQNKDSSSLTL